MKEPARLWQRALLGALSMIVWLSAAIALILYTGRRASFESAPAQLGVALALLLAYAACVRLIERRVPRELALGAAPGGFLSGLAIGLLIFAIVIGFFTFAGWYRIVSWHWSLQLAAGSLVAFTMYAVFEELLARAYIFRFLQNGLGTYAALIFSSLAFGFLHAANPAASVWSSVAIALEAGLLLGAGFALSGNLWFPIGLHAGWNFAEGTIFGTAVSGTTWRSLIAAHGPRVPVPAVLTGGDFGPEASFVTVIVSVAVAAGFVLRLAREGRIVSPLWLRRANARPG